MCLVKNKQRSTHVKYESLLSLIFLESCFRYSIKMAFLLFVVGSTMAASSWVRSDKATSLLGRLRANDPSLTSLNLYVSRTAVIGTLLFVHWLTDWLNTGQQDWRWRSESTGRCSSFQLLFDRSQSLCKWQGSQWRRLTITDWMIGWIQNNKIRDEGAKVLADALRCNSSLTSLNLYVSGKAANRGDWPSLTDWLVEYRQTTLEMKERKHWLMLFVPTPLWLPSISK